MSVSPQPDWDLTPFFSDVGAEDYLAFEAELEKDLAAVKGALAELPPPSPVNEALPAWIDFLLMVEDTARRLGHLSTYLACRVSAESKNEKAQIARTRLGLSFAELEKVWVRVRHLLLSVDSTEVDELLAHENLGPISHFLRRQKERGEMSMSPPLEDLAADFDTTGLSAWSRLYLQQSGNLTFTLVEDDQTRTVPVSQLRPLLEGSDAALRKAAFDGANKTWEAFAPIAAASLNNIAGARLMLYERRGIAHFLDPACFDAGIERKTLDTLMQVVKARIDVPQRFLKLKAKHLGKDALSFADRFAPLLLGAPGANAESEMGQALATVGIHWKTAKKLVLEAFAKSYPRLFTFSEKALDADWVDYTPRENKRPGGFCTTSHYLGQSRIFMTYGRAPGDVQTLAHELGHAFHGSLLKDERYFASRYPMTLAETASTFAEALVTESLEQALSHDVAGRLSILDAKLTDAANFLCNIPARFSFEKALYEKRGEGEVSVSALCGLMEDAQTEWYGDALAPDGRDPFFWASKQHFYFSHISFYNFPYTFGFLFSLGLFARFKAEGEAFLPAYERLLRQTGRGMAEAVVKETLGIDLSAPDFWHASLDLIEADLNTFSVLTR
jgi:oligoendopeptidase F